MTLAALEMIETKAACADLVAAFAHHVDHRSFGAAVDLFTDDGCFERPDLTARGKAEIAGLWTDRPSAMVTRHLCGPPFFVSVGALEVQAVTYFTLYIREQNGDEAAPLGAPTAVGEYHDRFVRVEGRWRIQHRRALAVLSDRQGSRP